MLCRVPLINGLEAFHTIQTDCWREKARVENQNLSARSWQRMHEKNWILPARVKQLQNRRHLGSAMINIDHLNQLLDKLLGVENLFSKQFKVNYAGKFYSWTSKKLRDNLEQGLLYFDSPTHGPVGRWCGELRDNYIEKAFSREIDAPDGVTPNELEALRGILVKYLRNHIDCTDDRGRHHEMEISMCNGCSKSGNCLLYTLYLNRQKVLNNPCYPNYKWFTEVYDLTTVGDSHGDNIKRNLYHLIADPTAIICECRDHNASVLAEECNGEEIPLKLDEYTIKYDSSLGNELVNFELLVQNKLSEILLI